MTQTERPPAGPSSQLPANTNTPDQSEARYREIFLHAPMGLFCSTADGRILDVNYALVQLAGYSSREELMQQPAQSFYVVPADRAEWQARIAKNGAISNFFTQMRKRDGTVIWTRHNTRAVYDSEGVLAFYEGTVEDVTERRQEDLERQRLLETARLQAAELEALRAVSLKLTASLQAGEVLDTILHSVFQLLPDVLTTHIFLYSNDTLYFAAAQWADGRDEMIAEPRENGLTYLVARSGQPLVIDDMQSHPVFAGSPPEWKGRIVGLPLQIGQRVVGVMNVSGLEPRKWLSSELRMLRLLADQAAIAIENAHLYEQAQAELRERRRVEAALRVSNKGLEFLNALSAAVNESLTLERVLETALSQIVRLLDVDAAECRLLDDEGNLRQQTRYGFEELEWDSSPALCSDCPCIPFEESREFWVTNDLDGHCCAADLPPGAPPYQTLLCVPIVGAERRLGSVVLYVLKQREIQPEIQQWLRIAGGHLAAAIERARLFEAERAQRQHIARLHQSLQEQFTTLEKTQARLIQSEKLAAIGELVAGVAHELNNPLGSVVLYSQLLQRKGVDEQFQRDLNRIVEQAHRASNIVQSLLDFARQRTPERKLVQVNELLSNSLDLVSYELSNRNIFTETRLAPDLPLALADPHQIQQVLLNLISNAYQAISAHQQQGYLLIQTFYGRSHYSAEKSKPAPVVRVVIRDDGPGIPAEVMPRIFDPFFTTKQPGEGTGLGLAVCHGIISEHNGQIWAESIVGDGTTFYIELPVALDSEKDTVRMEVKPAPLANSAHVLVVDDERAVQSSIARSLQEAGYIVDAVDNGNQALLRLAETEYDLILCDIRMPEMSGRELYRNIQATAPALTKRVIFITGDSVSPATHHFLSAVNAPYLVKPFELNQLLSTIRQQLEEKVG